MTLAHAHTDKLKGLYAITDDKLIPEARFQHSVELALQGGTKIIQYRDKSDNQQKRLQQAGALSSLCKKYQAISIINDDIELAMTVQADGIHIGKEDVSLSKARQLLGEKAIIGVSCYNDLQRAVSAEQDGASYVAFGAMFSSPTKPHAIVAGPDIISLAKQQLSIPVCCIGGISEKNIAQLITQGTDMAAVISSLFSCKDIKQAAISLSQQFTP